jgi:hypothetical protein
MVIQRSVYIKYLQLSLKVEVRFFGYSWHFDTKGGLLTFAASAKSKGQCEENERSGHQPDFSVV